MIDVTNAATSLTISGEATNGGTGSDGATTHFNKTGPGTLILSGLSKRSGTGVTAVTGSTLQFGQRLSIYSSLSTNWTAAHLAAASGGTLAFNVGGTGEVTTGDVTTLLTNLAASTTVPNGTTTGNGMNAGSFLGFDTTNASGGTFTIADVIANTTGAAGGVRGVTKLGAGTLVLSNIANSYTGVTTISAGTLEVQNGTAIANSGAVSIASVAGAKLLVSASETIGSLSGGTGANGEVALGANTLTVGDSSTTTFGGTISGTLTTGTLIKQGAGVLNLAPDGVLSSFSHGPRKERRLRCASRPPCLLRLGVSSRPPCPSARRAMKVLVRERMAPWRRCGGKGGAGTMCRMAGRKHASPFRVHPRRTTAAPAAR